MAAQNGRIDVCNGLLRMNASPNASDTVNLNYPTLTLFALYKTRY